jgi:hypothetical protein
MKDLIQIAAIITIIWGIILAAPVFGIIVGSGFGAWFLLHAWREENKNGG